MKTFSSLCIVFAGILFLALPARVSAEEAVSFDFFYQELDPHGDWLYVDDYGYCWQPRVDRASWRPYLYGSWAYTDDAWTWVSDEEWGWATYHYGRWVNLDDFGWVWVPGYEWAPAWVSWRESPEYIGWAPLPPEPRGGVSISVSFGFDTGPGWYNFCPTRYFGAPYRRDRIVPIQQNTLIVENTTYVNNIITYNDFDNNEFFYNAGPSYGFVERYCEAPIRRARLNRIDPLRHGRDRRWRNSLRGDSLQVVAPRVRSGGVTRPQKVNGVISQARVNDGWAQVRDQRVAERLWEKSRQEALNARQRSERLQIAHERQATRERETRRQQAQRRAAVVEQQRRQQVQNERQQDRNRQEAVARREVAQRQQTQKKSQSPAPPQSQNRQQQQQQPPADRQRAIEAQNRREQEARRQQAAQRQAQAQNRQRQAPPQNPNRQKQAQAQQAQQARAAEAQRQRNQQARQQQAAQARRQREQTSRAQAQKQAAAKEAREREAKQRQAQAQRQQQAAQAQRQQEVQRQQAQRQQEIRRAQAQREQEQRRRKQGG